MLECNSQMLQEFTTFAKMFDRWGSFNKCIFRLECARMSAPAYPRGCKTRTPPEPGPDFGDFEKLPYLDNFFTNSKLFIYIKHEIFNIIIHKCTIT